MTELVQSNIAQASVSLRRPPPRNGTATLIEKFIVIKMDSTVFREVRMSKDTSLSVEIVITVFLISDTSMRVGSKALREKQYFSKGKGNFNESPWLDIRNGSFLHHYQYH